MRQLRADIDVARALTQGIEIFAKAFPVPLQALMQYSTGNIFNTFHQFDKLLAIAGSYWREPDAAISHHHRGHSVPAGRRQPGIPYRLGIIVRMNVDETRRNEKSTSVYFLAPGKGYFPHRCDFAVLHSHIELPQFAAQPVGHMAAADYKIEV